MEHEDRTAVSKRIAIGFDDDVVKALAAAREDETFTCCCGCGRVGVPVEIIDAIIHS